MSDRRKHNRRHLIYYLRILDNMDNLMGYLIDLSEGGIMMLNESPYPIGDRFDFKIKLPKELELGEWVSFKGEVKWTQEDINNDFYDIGIQILDFTDQKRAIFEKLVEQAGFLN